MSRRFHRVAALTVSAGALLASTTVVAVEPAFRRNFDGPETTWQLLETDVPGRILEHECVSDAARDGAGSERVVAAAPAGESLLLFCRASPVAVLPELEIRIWVKANRPDVQLAARVRLPRTLGAQGRSDCTTIVRGAMYKSPGQWQQLVLTDVPKLLAAQIRVMRSTPGATIDPREAFIDAVVMVVPGEPQGVEVVTDELQVDGVVVTGDDAIELASYPVAAPPTASASAPPDTPVRLQGGLLLVADKPFLPRIIQWQGESLSFLAERGFNAVRLPGPPTDEQIADAQRYALWFMCSPPRPDVLARDGLGRVGDRVLAWCLEDDAIEVDPNYARRWADLVRDRDAVSGRPVIITPEGDWNAASLSADILLARHARVGLISGPHYDQWLQRGPKLARPGTPFWACIATQFDDAVHRQSNALAGAQLPAPSVEEQQIESILRIACARGARGFVFQSTSSLSEADAATRERAATLELINRRLQLIEPWLAAGKVIGRIASSDAEWTGMVMHVDRARLLIPVAEPIVSTTTAISPPVTPAANRELVFLVPGVPESSQAFVLTPASLRTLPLQRVAGGTRLVLPSTNDAFLLITEDPQVIQSLRQRIAREGAAIVRLQRDFAIQRATSITDTARRLTQIGYNADAAARNVGSIHVQLRQIDPLLAAGQAEQASLIAGSVNKALARVAAEQRRCVGAPATFDSHPLALSSGQVAEHAAFERSFDSLRDHENLLYGGDFEDLGQMTRFGWQHFQHPLPGVDARVELSTNEPQHGRYCLELQATTASARPSEDSFFSAPAWIVSPSMPVTEGQLIEITGWVRVDEPIAGDGDGLQIVDSLGGPELSLAIRQTSGWQPFRMIRAVPESSELRLTFAFAGLGAARIDAVMVRTLQQPIARRLPTTVPSENSGHTHMAEQTAPLPVAPQSR